MVVVELTVGQSVGFLWTAKTRARRRWNGGQALGFAAVFFSSDGLLGRKKWSHSRREERTNLLGTGIGLNERVRSKL